MDIAVSFLIGIIIGSLVTYSVVQESQQYRAIRKYESQIQILKEKHQQALKEAKNRSLDGSRAVIKGKIAEQIAPVLPNFKYLPSDARFIGDPVDYIVFNGYTDLKDNGGSESHLEIVILDVKTGRASLSQFQQAIARAIEAGRVRFEAVRPEISEQQPIQKQDQSLQHDSPQKTYSVPEIRKTYPRAYEPWSKDEDEQLALCYRQGMTLKNLATEFQRKPGGIRSRLRKLGLL